MELTIKAYFNKMTRDSKKDSAVFHAKGEAEDAPEIESLHREIVEISVDGLAPLTAEFKKLTRDDKKTILDFVVNKGASNDHAHEYYKLAGKDIELKITKSKVTVEQFREGLKVKVNADGTAEVVDKNQTTLEQFIDPMAAVTQGNEQNGQASFNEETRSEQHVESQNEDDDL